MTTVVRAAGMRKDHHENGDNHQMADPVHLAELERCGGQQRHQGERGETTDQRRPEQCEGQAEFHDTRRGHNGGDIKAQS